MKGLSLATQTTTGVGKRVFEILTSAKGS
jgi:hypothetical protein